MNIDALGPDTCFELHCNLIYVFIRGFLSPLFASKPKENLQYNFVGYV